MSQQLIQTKVAKKLFLNDKAADRLVNAVLEAIREGIIEDSELRLEPNRYLQARTKESPHRSELSNGRTRENPCRVRRRTERVHRPTGRCTRTVQRTSPRTRASS